MFCLCVKVLAFKLLCICKSKETFEIIFMALLVTNGVKLQIIMGLDKNMKRRKAWATQVSSVDILAILASKSSDVFRLC